MAVLQAALESQGRARLLRGGMARKAVYNRAYYQTHRERLRRDQAAYYRRHSETIKARVQKNRKANPEDPEAKRLRDLDWYRRKVIADPTYFARKQARRRAGERGDVDYDYIWFRDFGICHVCGQGSDRGTTEFDHVVPLSRGGSHSEDNIKVTHGFCNRSKGARLLEEMVV